MSEVILRWLHLKTNTACQKVENIGREVKKLILCSCWAQPLSIPSICFSHCTLSLLLMWKIWTVFLFPMYDRISFDIFRNLLKGKIGRISLITDHNYYSYGKWLRRKLEIRHENTRNRNLHFCVDQRHSVLRILLVTWRHQPRLQANQIPPHFIELISNLAEYLLLELPFELAMKNCRIAFCTYGYGATTLIPCF